jgi:hypothetical protein
MRGRSKRGRSRRSRMRGAIGGEAVEGDLNSVKGRKSRKSSSSST